MMPRYKILVVEDEKEAAVLLREIMSHAYDIATAGTMAEGLAAMTGIDAVLLDLRLPNGQGCAVIREFKGKYPSVPIVVLTGCDVDEKAAKAAGARHVLRKPQESLVVIGALYLAIVGAGPAEEAARESHEVFKPAKKAAADIKESVQELQAK